MKQKVWTASDMGRKGIRAMLQRVADEHCNGDTSNDFENARAWIAKRNAKRKGAERGGRPVQYPECTSLIPYGRNKGKPRGRHRFKNGVCSCGQEQT